MCVMRPMLDEPAPFRARDSWICAVCVMRPMKSNRSLSNEVPIVAVLEAV
jgi:hypothetical protein